MTKNFTATIGSETFDDPALFEAEALAQVKAKRLHNGYVKRGQVRGESETFVKSILRGWKPTRSRKPFEPTGLEVGAEIAYAARDGFRVSAQVWSEAPNGGVWAVTDDREALWISKREGIVYPGLPAGQRSLGGLCGDVAA